jgi:putative ABC transport system ATP-binding protein
MDLSNKQNNNELFKIVDVEFQLRETKILSEISATINLSDITGIIGPSGAGKSTFLRLLNKLISPTNGNIYYKSQNTNKISSQKIRKEIGFVQQRPYLFNGTVKHNLLYGPKLWNIEYSDEELVQLLQKVALEKNFLEKQVEGLSGGEQQRVSLARSLANKPSVLLLDEPTSSLDINSEEIIETSLKQLNQEGIKIIIVTHSLEQTERITDSLLFLREGKLIEKIPTEKFFSKYDNNEIRLFFKDTQSEDRK